MEETALSSLFGLSTGGGGATLGDLATATSAATSGAVTAGDRILGGNKRKQLGIVKILAIFAGAAVAFKIYKGFKR